MLGTVALAVEHDRALLALYVELLEAKGHRVRVARTAKDAIEQLDLDVDVLIVDLHSQDSGGAEFLRWLGAHSDYRDMPVLGITPATRNDQLKLTATLHKPFAFDTFVATVDSLARTSKRGRRN